MLLRYDKINSRNYKKGWLCWTGSCGGTALDAYKKSGESGGIKADEGMITFSEAFGRGYTKRTTYDNSFEIRTNQPWGHFSMLRAFHY